MEGSGAVLGLDAKGRPEPEEGSEGLAGRWGWRELPTCQSFQRREVSGTGELYAGEGTRTEDSGG